jgi:hypothetical protein
MKAKLLSTIDNSWTYTMAVAKSMPESNLNFRPSPDVFTFLELMNHIAYGIIWWKENYIRKNETPWAPPVAFTTRNDTNQYLEGAFQSFKESLDSTKLNDEVIHGIYATLDHITHHRGQATVYLRAIGLTPPEYVF